MTTGLNTPTKTLTTAVRNILRDSLEINDITTTDEAIKSDKVLKYIQSKIDENNTTTISRAQNIRKFRLLPIDFSLEGGELTPTLKLKRKVVLEKNK